MNDKSNRVDPVEGYLETQRLSVMAVAEIHRAMAESGLKNSDLAARIGVPRSRVTRVLDGLDNFTLKTLAVFGLGCGFRWSFTLAPMQVVVALPSEPQMLNADASSVVTAAPTCEVGAAAPTLAAADWPLPAWALN